MSPLPDWATWPTSQHPSEFTVGVEEEVMLVRPGSWELAQVIDDVLPEVSPELGRHVAAETHGAALELATGVHGTAGEAAEQLTSLRERLAAELEPLGLRAAVAGMHPFTQWSETRVSEGARYQLLHGSMRELVRREPTFALHVHVAVRTPERAIRLLNRMRTHLPMLLGLSANSPFWQGRDSGLASSRVPVFQAFPRVGIPRRFADYADYAEAIDLMIRCGAFPEPTFLWWDARLQPRFGTLEVRIMDAQTRVADTAALVALIQSLARMELEEGLAPAATIEADAVLDENRFLAARDGADARLLDVEGECQRPLGDVLEPVLEACRPHAAALDCEAELENVAELFAASGAARQREIAGDPADLRGLTASLSEDFTSRRQQLPASGARGDSRRSPETRCHES